MIDKTLRLASYNEYKKHRLASWFLSFFVIACILLFVILSFLYPGVLLLVTPLLILPMVFASYMTHLTLTYGQELTFNTVFKSFISFYQIPNNGTFRYWVSILKYLIATLILEFVFGVVASVICYSFEPEGFKEMINIFYNAYLENVFVTDLNELFGEYYSVFVLFNNIVTISTSLVSGLYIFYLLTLNSLSFYLRLNLKQANNQFIDLVFKNALKKHKNVIRNNFLNLEWPIFILFIVGSIIGAVITLFYSSVADMVILNATTVGILSTFFFLPFHFANMEVLFKRYEMCFLDSIKEVTESLFKRFGGSSYENPDEKDK